MSIGFPLSLALSPLLRREEREFTVVCGGRIWDEWRDDPRFHEMHEMKLP